MDLQAPRSMKDQNQECCYWVVVILLHVLFRREGISVHAVDNLLALLISLSPLPKLQQMPGLDLEQAALDGGGPTQPP
jgi:hypothetical protein